MVLVDAEYPPVSPVRATPGPAELTVARHIAARVEDGATLQVGIVNLLEAVLSALHGLRNLGLHSGTVGDGMALLAEAGVLTHARKTLDTGIGGILIGTDKLRRWAHCNPGFQLRETGYTIHRCSPAATS